MGTVRYRVNGVKGSGAFFPMPALTPLASSHGMIQVYGAPGTQRLPSPQPAANPPHGPDPRTKPSNVVPSWWLPDIYYTRITNLPPAGGRISWMPRFNVIPPVTHEVPEQPVPAVAMRRRKIGGRRTMKWPRAITRWPNLQNEGG